MKILAAALLWAAPLCAAERFSVAFVNIGEPAPFWDVFVAFMRAAAEDLDVDLEVLDARGDHLRMIELAEQACAHRPDYLVINNDKQMAGRMLEHATAAGVKTFLVHNLFAEEQAQRYGRPREKYPLWIGSLRPDHEAAGHALARALAAQARGRFPEPTGVLAISGVRATQAAADRDAGLRRAVGEGTDLELLQLVHSQWQREKARRQMLGLLRRWPEARLVWAANDPMALGVLDAARARGREPGRDLLVGGINWSIDALELVHKGELALSVGGHFMGGAWTLVLLRDHHDGVDFAPAWLEGVFQMGVVDRSNADAYLASFGAQRWDAIDFTRFSRSLNPRQRSYDFGLEAVLRAVRR